MKDTRPLRSRGTQWIGAPQGAAAAPVSRVPRAVLLVALAGAAVPQGQPRARVILPPAPPARTVRLAAFQLAATVASPPARETRRGLASISRPHQSTDPRPGKRPLIVALVAPGVTFRVTLTRVPAATLRLAPFQTDATLIPAPAREPRRGQVSLTRVPARAVRLDAFQLAATVTPSPAREARRGLASISLPHQSTDPRPGKRPLIVALVAPGRTGRVTLARVPALTLRLAAFQTDATVIPPPAREPKRGQVSITHVPAPTLRRESFQLAVTVARRDERRYAGQAWSNRVPSRAAGPSRFQLNATVAPSPARDTRRGQVWLSGPHRVTASRPRPPVISPALPAAARWGPGRIILNAGQPMLRQAAPPGAAAPRAALIARRAPPPLAPRQPAGVILNTSLVLSRQTVATSIGVVGTPLGIRTAGRRNWVTLPHPPLFAQPLPRPHVLIVRLSLRDERRHRGSIRFSLPPSRTGSAVIIPPAPPLRPVISRRDERRYRGTVLTSRSVPRTVRLDPFQLDVTVVPPPARETRRGAVWLGTPHRSTIPRPAQRPLFVQPVPAGRAGSIITSRALAPTPRLASFQLDVTVLPPPARETRRGLIWTAAPHRTTDPRLRKQPFIVLPVRPPEPGRISTSRVPAATLRLSPVFSRVKLFRRDERAYPGHVIQTPVHRPGAAVIVPTTARLTARVVRRDERRYAGATAVEHVPARTQRVGNFPVTVRPAARDERRGRGQVWIAGPHRLTVALPPALLVFHRALQRPPEPPRGRVILTGRVRIAGRAVPPVRVVRPTAPNAGGRVLLQRPPKAAVLPAGRAAAGVRPVMARARPGAGRPFLVRVPARTARLAPPQTRATVAAPLWTEPRRGRLLITRAQRPNPPPPPPAAARGSLIAQRPPVSPRSSVSQSRPPITPFSVPAVGMIRASVTLRPRPTATLMLRPVLKGTGKFRL